MSYRYFKPVIKYVSRSSAIDKLKLTNKQFDKIVVIMGIYPFVAENRNCYDKTEGWYYRIDDIKRIFYSEAYEVIQKNQTKENKRQNFIQMEQLERASKIIDEEFNFVDLIKQKYESLGSSIDDLGNTIKNLYLIDMLKIDDSKKELKEFEEFVIERSLLNKAFLSKKGIYFGFNIEKIIVFWMVPYPSQNLSDIVEEKKEIQAPKKEFNFDFLDFGSFEEEEDEEEEIKDPNNPDKFDISLLKYAFPLLKVHLKLILHKLRMMYPKDQTKKTEIFKNKKFNIDIKSIPDQIAFAILSGGGVVTELEEAEIIITESVDVIMKDKIYVHPQYIFDCINQSKMLPVEEYFIGKELPPHSSPFPNIIDTIDERALRVLSNKKKYSILDRVEKLN